MTLVEFDALVEAKFERIIKIFTIKNKEYGTEHNALDSFVKPCMLTKKDPYQTWLGFWLKGMTTLYDMIHSNTISGEAYEEKLEDSLAYLFLLKALVENTTMSFDELLKSVNNEMNYCRKTLNKKRATYERSSDRLGMFKKNADLMKTTPEWVLVDYMVKHTYSIIDMCQGLISTSPELWTEKITDHINYLLLLFALYEDRK